MRGSTLDLHRRLPRGSGEGSLIVCGPLSTYREDVGSICSTRRRSAGPEDGTKAGIRVPYRAEKQGGGIEGVQRDLVERAQQGDREAFGVLATASIGQLYNLAQLMLADADLASDVVQEALIAGGATCVPPRP